jgi:hypothetical protein
VLFTGSALNQIGSRKRLTVYDFPLATPYLYYSSLVFCSFYTGQENIP